LTAGPNCIEVTHAPPQLDGAVISLGQDNRAGSGPLPASSRRRPSSRVSATNGSQSSGIVCRGGDVSSFAAAIRDLSDPVRRAAFSAAARRYAERHSWEESLAPVYALYRTKCSPTTAAANAHKTAQAIPVR
jgi:hypothetical protein